MKIEVIRNHTCKSLQWSGGHSTELYIYPPGADFKKGDFSFRLSTATVTIAETTFTSLPGVTRTLMVLDGELLLVHEDNHSKLLKPFNQDFFKGEWKTKSYGKGTDFNLMTVGATKGELSFINFLAQEKLSLCLTNSVKAFYVYKGAIASHNLSLTAGDTLVLTSEIAEEEYEFIGIHDALLIEVSILQDDKQ